MSVEMQNEDKKEIKQQSKTIENAIVDQQIKPDEVLEVNKTTDFLKTVNKETNTKINEKIETYKDDILNSIYQYFIIPDDNTDRKKRLDEEKIKEITNEDIAQAYINLIDWTWSKELDVVKEELNEQINKIKDAKKKIETKDFELQKDKYLSVNEKTPQNVKKFFEEDREIYNAILDDIFEKQGWTDKIIINSNSKGEANSLYLRVQKYTGIEKLGDITIWKADKFDWTKNRFNNNERVVQYTVPAYVNEKWEKIEKKTKFIVQGTQEQMQSRIAENAVENWFIPNTIDRTQTYRKDKDGKVTEKWTEKPADTKEVKVSLNIFDDIGNFEAFRNFLNNQQNANTITNNIRSIITQIMNYEASSDTADASENPNDLKNWYANVFTEYMMKQSNPVILQIYVSYITKENLNLLWVDEATRINNYNRFFFSDPKNSKLRPEIETMLNNMNEDEKKIIIENIAQTRIAITGEKNWWTVENIKQWFDAFIDAFGPMLFNILWFLWVSKATLLKWFPGAAEKINEKFAEEYGLKDPELIALNNITQDPKFSKNEIKDYGPLVKADRIKKAYTEKIDNDHYISLIRQEHQHININVFSKWVDLYNKKAYKNDTAKYININDIINTKTEDDKEKIESLKNPELYETIIETIIDDGSTRSRIANANNDIQTEATYNKETLATNKQWLDNDDQEKYFIRSEKDIVRYLTASLFSDKELSYVMTENELHNWSFKPNNPNKNNNKPTETLSFTPDDVKDWVITATGGKKKIHEIFTDYTTAPKVLLFTLKGENTAKEIKKAKVDIAWTETETYVYTDDPTKAVDIKEWDKIEAIKTPEELYTENDTKIQEAVKDIKITDNKYKAFDYETFSYKKTATGEEKEYQENLLTPMSEMLSNEEQFKILSSDTDINNKLNKIWPINIKNTFLMLDNENTTKKYEDITKNITNRTKIEAKNNEIVITQSTWTITIKYEANALKTERKATT